MFACLAARRARTRANCKIRASSYQMIGNFLAACNEHEEAAKLIADGAGSQPASALLVAMDTNFGIW